MIRRIVPRRLGSDEEATLVEHLSELRHRVFISIGAIVPAFVVTFAFHSHLIGWLKRPLPDDKHLVTLGVVEPFTTAVKVSGLAAIAIVLPILVWQVWGFLAPAVDQATQRVLSVFLVVATALFATGVIFAYFVVLPAAVKFLTNFDDSLYNVQIRASYYLSFTSLVLLACGLAFEMPIFILALVRIRVLSSDKLRRNRRLGYVLMIVFAILLPTVDPVSLLFETVPLLILFESSIWLSRLMERRWNRDGGSTAIAGRCPDRRLGGLGRPRRRGARAGRCSRDRGRRHDRVGRDRSASSATASISQAASIVPGFVNCALAHRVRGVRGLRRRAPVRSLDRDAHRAQGGARPRRHGRRSRASARTSACAAGVTTIGDCSFAGSAALAAAETGLARNRLPRGVRARRDRRSTGSTSSASVWSPQLSDRVLLGVSPHAPYTCTLEVYAACAELGLPTATHFAESAAERDWLVERRRRLDAAGRPARAPARRDRDPAARRRRAARPAPHRSALRPCRRRGDRAARRARASGSRTARARTAISAAASLRSQELRAAGVCGGDRDGQPCLDAVARHVRGDPRGDHERTCARGASGRAHRSGGARARDARRRPRARDRLIASARSCRESRRISAVISLEGSPFDPVEDPAAAAVLGGSPDRVTATLVGGEQRYRKGTSAWPDSTRAARSARSRMLP